MRLDDDPDKIEKKDAGYVVKRKLIASQLESGGGQLLVQVFKPGHQSFAGGISEFFDKQREPERDQENGKNDDEKALDQVRPVGRPQTAKNAIDDNYEPNNWQEDCFQ